MSRLLSAMTNDVTLQVRNHLYTIGIVVGAVMAMGLAQLAGPTQLGIAAPVALLLVVGGSTLLYVAGMITFERDEGTLDATVVTPLRPVEYLASKVTTLTLLATVEAAVIVGGAMGLMSLRAPLALPNLPVAFAGTALLAVIYTLVGIVVIVRYDAITDFLVTVVGIASLLQLPFIYFLGVVEHWAFLVIPTAAPAMILQGAFVNLGVAEWIYATGYSGLVVATLAVWARRAFETHVIRQRGGVR